MQTTITKPVGHRKQQEIILSTLRSLPDLLDPEMCKTWLLSKFHPEGPACNVCGSQLSEKCAASFRKLSRVHCAACGHQFNAWTGTLLQGSQISPVDFMLIRVALAAGLGGVGMIQLTGRTRQFVTTWPHKIQQFNETYGEASGEQNGPFSPL